MCARELRTDKCTINPASSKRAVAGSNHIDCLLWQVLLQKELGGSGGWVPSPSRFPAQWGNGKGQRNGRALCHLLVKQLVSAARQEREALSLKLASLLSEHRVQFNKKFIFILPISDCEEDMCQGFESPTH